MNKPLKQIKVGTRGSPLALVQIQEIKNLIDNEGFSLDWQSITFQTAGDQDKVTPLVDQLPDDFFTNTIDQALLDKKINLAIHSAKDLAECLTQGLKIFALTESKDNSDCYVGKTKIKDLAQGAKIGTSSHLRQEALKNLNPRIEIVNIRGTIQERLELLEQGEVDGIIVATIALKRLGLEDRISEIMPWETTALQGQLAVVGRADDLELEKIFSTIDVREDYGTVTLLGAGPGDPELITVKAIKALGRSDCVFYDYLIHPSLLDYCPQANKTYVGKRKGKHSMPQAELSRLLRDAAFLGKNIVRLKGGDPFIFGRGAEEFDYLRSYHIPIEVIPGISSATGIPASLTLPLTSRDESNSVAFISGHKKDEAQDANSLLEIPCVDTIVFLMGLTKLDIILKSLLKANWKEETSIVIISKGTCIDEDILIGTLKEIKNTLDSHPVMPPALIIVGKSVGHWKTYYQQKQKILFTGTNPDKYRSKGQIIHWPMIEIKEHVLDQKEAARIKNKMDQYHVLILTSRFAVRYFFKWLKEQNVGVDQIKKMTICVIGQVTQRSLKEFNLDAGILPSVETSEGLFESLDEAIDLKGVEILFPRSSLSNPYLKEKLTKSGALVDEMTIYENLKPEKKDLPQMTMDAIFMTSPSQVKNFLEDYGTIPKTWKIYSKGPHTAKSLKEQGYESELLN